MMFSQSGKTECINNIIGYYIDQDPCPILVVQPTLEIAQAWSKDRFAPMITDTPRLQGKVKDVKTRFSDNTILHKAFEGGHITICGANSPSSLASRPIRIIICDEIDKYPLSSGGEGDPINLAFKRASTFWNRKKILTSTPTIKDISKIEEYYERSDKRKYYVPCPFCKEKQVLVWAQLIWPEGTPEKARYVCAFCKKEIDHSHKEWMLSKGIWKPETKFNGIAGFWINELYSPWVSWGEMAVKFLEDKKNPETLKTFINTSLAQTWEEEGETIECETLNERLEPYSEEVPEHVCILTAGVDIQKDRIEAEVVGWGKDYESWGIEFRSFFGDTSKLEVWKELDVYLSKVWMHQLGVKILIACVFIDSGFLSQQVYEFVKPRIGRRIFAIKGLRSVGSPVVGRPSRNNSLRVPLFPIGTESAKDQIFSWLKLTEPGPGYMHYPEGRGYDEEYFRQLTAEKAVVKMYKGIAIGRQYIKIRPRNEALDMRVYAYGAIVLLSPNFSVLMNNLKAKIPSQEKKEEREIIRRKKGGFVMGWKR